MYNREKIIKFGLEKELFSNVHKLDKDDDLINQYRVKLDKIVLYLNYVNSDFYKQKQYSSDVISFIIYVNRKIIESLENYMEGNYSTAKNIVIDIVKNYKMISKELISTLEVGKKRFTINLREYYNYKKKQDSMIYQRFYKARNIQSANNLRLSEMFHIPFDKRYLISNQRFSINGFPCLYLGTSSLCCLQELGGIPDQNFHLSTFQLDKEMKFLYLNYSLYNYYRTYDENDENKWKFTEKVDEFNQDEFNKFYKELDVREYLVDLNSSIDIYKVIRNINTVNYTTELMLFLPLLISVSFKVEDSDNYNFKLDYIFPQLLMDALKDDEGIDGVAYLSCKIGEQRMEDMYTNPAILHTNLAIPARYDPLIDSKYSSTLINHIKLTAPITFSTFKNIKSRNQFPNITIVDDYAYLGTHVKYSDTEYWDFDNYRLSQFRLPVNSRVGIFKKLV
ncbi:hypothetical protein RJG79_10570 [Mycoplasmatota bacterium WC44]